MFSRVGKYFNFVIVNAENTALNKYILQSRRMPRIISEIVVNSALIPS